MNLTQKACSRAKDEFENIRNQIFDLEDCIRTNKKDDQGNLWPRELIAEELREVHRAMTDSLEWLEAIEQEGQKPSQ